MSRPHFIKDKRGLVVGRVDEDDRERRGSDLVQQLAGRFFSFSGRRGGLSYLLNVRYEPMFGGVSFFARHC